MRNNFETQIYKELCKAYGKNNVSYESVQLPYIQQRIYTPDFYVQTLDGDFVVETKGYFRQDNRRLMRDVQEQHPDKDIRLIFQQDRKYSKRMRYSDWAEKYGFEYSVGKVPKDW